MKNDVYSICPTYKGNTITLRQTKLEDAAGLLTCYSDQKAVPLFNSDNCHGDDFYYQTMERMKQAIEFWDFSYGKKYFVRWTIIENITDATMGTIEMFHRIAEDEFNHFGVLRIDLQSQYEKKEYIDDILAIANQCFFADFNVESILTKAIPSAFERISALRNKGYLPLNRKFMVYDDYFVRKST
jgi:[ribosomal protein S5]-alanine N-acetyltransferase